jgi:hypothetical protein
MKKFYSLIILWALLSQCSGLSTTPTAPTAPKPEIPVSVKRLTADVQTLASLDPPRNHQNVSSLDRAADYIFKEFKKCTTQVEVQRYQVNDKEYKNVIASFGPMKGKRIIVGAHYDVCGDQPGADDNGTGAAAVLELARLLSALKPKLKRRIDLVAYSLEEPPYFRTPYMGSAIHAASLAKAKVKVHVMISIDMIGYFSETGKPHRLVSSFIKPGTVIPGNTTGILGKKGEEKITDTLKKHITENSNIAVLALNLPLGTRGLDFSDHLNYWKHTYPAVMITNFMVCPNFNYHKPTDTIEKLNFEKIAEIVKGLYFVLVKI